MNAFTDALNRLTMGRAILLGLVISAFYYFLLLDPGLAQKTQITAANTRITELNTQIDENTEKLNAAAVYKKTAAEVGSTINKLLSLIPEQFGMSDLMRIVSNETKVAGLSVATIDPKSTSVSSIAKEFEELVVTVDMSGSFLQHMVFLANLTKINQIIFVRKFEFQSEREARGDEAPVVKLTAEIVAFRYRGADKKSTTEEVK